jgi:CheY-like chemotaxis protein
MEERPPDFVPLDLEMVGMSGTEVLREILETGRLSDDTVVVMSAHPSEEVEDELRKARAKDVTDKPVRLRLLREALSELKLRQ